MHLKGYDDIPKEIPDADAKKVSIDFCVSTFNLFIQKYHGY